jgi:DNA-binding ferritin-like protein
MAKTRSRKQTNQRSTRKHRSTKSKTPMIREFIQTMFSLQLTLKMVHWATKSYAVHKATDKIMNTISPLIDSFVESFLGKHNYTLKQDEVKDISIKKLSNSAELKKFIKKNNDYLVSLNKYIHAKEHSDLVSIRDSIMSELNVLNYLLDLEK